MHLTLLQKTHSIKKTAEATGDLIGNTIAKRNYKSLKTFTPKYFRNSLKRNRSIKRCISPKERQQIADELRLVIIMVYQQIIIFLYNTQINLPNFGHKIRWK